MAKLGTLEDQPERCSIAAESEDLGQEIRELLLGRRRYEYRILFKLSGRLVVILRVWHGSRDSITREEIE
jgi:plasmid stabilization system protein ParE